jgi:hypothetical protein
MDGTMEGMRNGRHGGSGIPLFLEGVKPKRGKYKINSSMWMADGIVECQDTTTNQKRAGVEEERMENVGTLEGVYVRNVPYLGYHEYRVLVL